MIIAFEIIIDFVFGIIIAVTVVVNCKGPTLLGLTLSPAVVIIIVYVDKAKGPMISDVRGLDAAIDTFIVKQ